MWLALGTWLAKWWRQTEARVETIVGALGVGGHWTRVQRAGNKRPLREAAGVVSSSLCSSWKFDRTCGEQKPKIK